MRIVITGGSGNVGRYVAPELLDHGHEVTIFDRLKPESLDVPFVEGSILDIDACRRAFRGSDVVIHLAAIPHPLDDPPEVVMHVNTTGTFIVHQAAVDIGVRRVVHASSDSSYGLVFRRVDFSPDYLPLDEEHPQKPQDAYGLSKKVGEAIARSFTRGYALETVALRICFVWFPHMAESYRPLTTDPGDRKWINGLWLYNDARDVATAFRLAAEIPDLRNEVFLISAEENGTVFETMELVRKYYGRVSMRKKLKGRESLADYSKAALILGYRPRYTWRDIVS